MEKVINVSDASISTATIEVKVMKIGNRQVTLAVFRQLPLAQIIDQKTGELRGIPWGRVNYHVDCDSYVGPHLHIVWQKGNELYRCVEQHPEYSHTDEWITTNPVGISWQVSFIELRHLDQLFIAV